MNNNERSAAAGCGTLIGFAVIAAVAASWVGFFATMAAVACLRLMGVS